MPCLYSLNDDEYEGYGQLQGGKDRNCEERACHALLMCPSPWGGRVRDLPLLSSNEPVGRVLPVRGLGREAGTGCEQVVTAL